MRQRVSVITLGVRDLARARRFYEALGWETGAEPGDDVAFFQAGEMVLALWDRAKLAEDSCVEDTPGWGGVTLAVNFGSREEVDAATEEARAAGATIGREPVDVLGRLQLGVRRSGGTPLGGRPQPALDDYAGRRDSSRNGLRGHSGGLVLPRVRRQEKGLRALRGLAGVRKAWCRRQR